MTGVERLDLSSWVLVFARSPRKTSLGGLAATTRRLGGERLDAKEFDKGMFVNDEWVACPLKRE